MNNFFDLCYPALPAKLTLSNGTKVEDILFKKLVDDEWEIPRLKFGGAVYTRWGSSNCLIACGTRKVYSGMAGKSFYTHQGGGTDFQCMPENL